ncbi:hypothetical protein [Streptomyces sp. LN699]|uniref:hypothetical protein n=1 Tax=Streptomyces sp. LN699 TaxID=3112981 RepID=UPI003710EBBE
MPDDAERKNRVEDALHATRAASLTVEDSKKQDAAADGIQEIPAQIQAQESPTVAVARERLVEAIGREAAYLADQRAGQAAEGLETLARAFALVTGNATRAAGPSPAAEDLAIQTRGLLPADQDVIAQRETVEINQR